MRQRCVTIFVAASAALCSALLTAVGAAAGLRVTPVAASASTAGTAGQVTASGALHPAGIFSVSCASAGNCGAGGFFLNSLGNQAALVVSERNGTWGAPREVARSAGLPGQALAITMSVSCAAAGSCGAGGYYETGGYMYAFVAGEKDGAWGTAAKVRGLAANGDGEVYSVSCGSAGNCSAGGSDYTGPSSQQAFVVDEANGIWGRAQQVPGLAALNKKFADIGSVSCASAGNCSAGGSYTDRSGGLQAFVVSEKNGTWGRAQQVPGLAALNTGGQAGITSLSCASAGNCSGGGFYAGHSGTQAFVVGERHGTWSTAQEVRGSARLNTGGIGQIASVSCASAGDCSAGGDYSGRGAGAFVVSEQHGIWGSAKQVPGLARLGGGGLMQSVSCGSAGNCSAGGDYDVGGCCSGLAFVVSEQHGIWGGAQPVPGLAGLGAEADGIGSVSCSSAGNCSAGGSYQISNLPPTGPSHAFVVSEQHGIWGNAKTFPVQRS